MSSLNLLVQMLKLERIFIILYCSDALSLIFDITDVKTYRVGKKLAGKIRPLKVILKNELDARLIVKKF